MVVPPISQATHAPPQVVSPVATSAKVRPLPAIPALILSLDFELCWGIRDSPNHHRYADSHVRQVRELVPALLSLFQRYNIHATWATVGLLMFDSKRELLKQLPDLRPTYQQGSLSPYHSLDEVGLSESADPYHFGLSLVQQILEIDGQELGTHTFCHFFCLEPGQVEPQFRADLDSATRRIRQLGPPARSLVFPKNQCNHDYLETCADQGINVVRGIRALGKFQGSREWATDRRQRMLRLSDAYVDLRGNGAIAARAMGRVVDVPGSMFLRPYDWKLSTLESSRVKRTISAMTAAIEDGCAYHLWWHPHNFGRFPEANLKALETILLAFDHLRTTRGIPSCTMSEYADLAKALA